MNRPFPSSGARTAGADQPLAVGTIADRRYLPLVRVLARSLHRYHPDLPLFFLIADEQGDASAVADGGFEQIPLAALDLPQRRSFLFRHCPSELPVALKPIFIRFLLDRGFAAVLYLDADLWVVGDLDPLLTTVRRHALTLSPHRLASSSGEEETAVDLRLLRAGAFNGGIIGVAAGEEATRFLDWMQERLAWDCRFALEEGLHLDQRWLDLVPGLFSDVVIDRDPGVNLAYWNFDQRPVTLSGGGYETCVRIGPALGRIVHFSGFDPARPEIATRHFPQLAAADLGAAAPLYRNYLQLLAEAGWNAEPQAARLLDSFDNGVPIPELARRIFSELWSEADRFGDPFVTAQPGSFFRWLNEPAAGRGSPSHLWLAVHGRRHDLRAAFPDPCGRDHRRFRRWTREFGLREYALAPVFSGEDPPD